MAFHLPSVHNPIYPQSFLAWIYKTSLYIPSLFSTSPGHPSHYTIFTFCLPPKHHSYFWLKKFLCINPSFPLMYTTQISDLSIALFIQHLFTDPLAFLTWVLPSTFNPLYTTYIVLDLSISLYIKPLFTPLTFLTWVLPSTSNSSLQHFHFWLEYCPLHPTALYTTLISDLCIALYIQFLFTWLTFLTRVLPSVSAILGIRMGRTSSLNAVRSEYSSTIVRRAFPEIHLADRALSCKREKKNVIRCKDPFQQTTNLPSNN